MDTSAARFPLRPLLGGVAWQMGWVVVLGFGLFLHYSPEVSLAQRVGPALGLPLIVLSGLMLSVGMIWVVWLVWRVTQFLFSSRSSN